MPARPSVVQPATHLPSALGLAAGTAATAFAIGQLSWAEAPSIVLGWICLVPWLLVLDRTRSVGGALSAGLLMSGAFVAAVFGWFPRMIADYTGASWLVGAAVVLVVAPVLEPQFVTFAIARHLAARAPGSARWWHVALVGAGVYVGTEWLWPKLLADTLAHGIHASTRIRQAADLVSAHGLTFGLILGNECVRAIIAARPATPAWPRRVAPPAVCLVLLIGGLAAYGAVRLTVLDRRNGDAPVTIATIQGNLTHYDALRAELGTFEVVRRILDTHFALSAEALQRTRLDLLVWPETVYPTTFGAPKSVDGADFDRAITTFVANQRVPLVFGAYAVEDGKEFNAAFLLEPVAGDDLAADHYRKSRLFPFTERLPWPLDSAPVRRWLPWAGAWTPGGGPGVLDVDTPGGRTLRIAPLICYDALDADFAVAGVRQGAELLLTMSNDSWFAFPGIQRLIMIVAAFRSIETRRPQLRSTPTGVSALIDQTGALVDVLGPDERGVLVGTLRPEREARTLVLAWGNWLPPAALAGSILLLIVAYARRRTDA